VSQYFGNNIRGATNATILNAHAKWFSTPKDEQENEKQEEERKKETTFVLVENKKNAAMKVARLCPLVLLLKAWEADFLIKLKEKKLNNLAKC
jgi:hypothetical protein